MLPNPPAGLVDIVDVVVVVVLVVVVAVTAGSGAALAHPPKSSSAATVGEDLAADAAGAPHPLPMSLAVNVSGTFIMVDGAGAAAGSGVLQASLPQASMLLEKTLDVVAAIGLGAGAGAGAGAGLERLKIELRSADGEDTALGGGEVVVVRGEDDRPNKSLEEFAAGGFGFEAGVAVLVKPKPRPLDEMEVARCGCGFGAVLDVRLSNNPPPVDILGELT